jgi:hypothetical protein
MPLLSKKYLGFDKDDVRLMQTMMKQFHDMHSGTGMPDYSSMYAGYLPGFAIALLASQESVERLTKKLVCLTWVVVFLTVALALLALRDLILVFRFV